jgi:hypothetical protein
MSKETTNQGYVDALAYATDPDNVDTPDQQHNEYERGIKSYGLSQDGDSAALNSLLTADTINSRVGVNEVTPAVEMDVSGNIRASGGILFGANTAETNTLQYYEEGSWTPALVNIGTGTYTAAAGSYTRIGNVVTVQLYVQMATLGTASGILQVSGLPFVSSSTSYNFHSVPYSANAWATPVSDPVGDISTASTVVNIFKGNGGALVSATHAELGAIGYISSSFTYRVD